MIADLKPYPAYKDSGVEWLGEVPEHWGVLQLRRVALNRCDGPFGSGLKSSHYTEEGVRVVRLQNIGHGEFKNSDAAFISPEHYASLGDHSVVAGDILIAGLGDSNHPAGRACVAPASIIPAMVKADCFRFRLNQARVEPRFAALQLTATATVASALLSTGATRQRTNLQSTSARAIAIPEIPEQAAITHFLDYTDRRIQRYIRAKQKLITLLEEQKQALIHQAVTGRIDVRTGQPYPAYQDSGVEWLGEVPERWEVRKLRRCVTVSGGMTPSMEVHRFWGGLIPWVTPKDMKRAVISDSSVRVTDSAIQETPLRLIEPPAVLIVVRGMILARRVPIASTTAPVTINQDMKALRTVEGTNAAFLARLLDSAQEAFMPLIDEAGHGTRRLPMERWREIVIAIPPEEEQATIVEHLDNRTAAIDTTISHTQRQIDLLNEYRTRLISDVVTGKLDVREAAATLPEVDPLEIEGNAEETIETTAELAEDLSTITAGA